MIELNKIYNEDCIEGIKRIPDNSIDCILTDPPYLYLKKQRLDREFDEVDFFKECKCMFLDFYFHKKTFFILAQFWANNVLVF